MMKYVFILAFLGATLYASIKTSGIGFDYENANRFERTEWLEYQKKITQSNLNRALRSKHGYNTPYIVEDIVVRGEQLEAVLKTRNGISRMELFREREDLMETMCPQYMKLPISDHDRTVLLTVNNVSNVNVGRITIRMAECERALANS